MKYTLKQLQVFAETARFGNISRAADVLSLSQSAASNALKELESQFDVQLFDRIGKRLKLNETGKSIRAQTEKLLEQANSLESILSKESALGELKIGATLTIGNYLISNMMVDYLQQNPNGKIDLKVDNTALITQKILQFQLDIGLIEGEVNHPDLNITTWRGDELTLFASPTHPLAQKNKLDKSDILTAKWILREKGSGTRQIFERDMGSLFKEINILLELGQTQAIKQAVKSGLGIGCLSKIALQESFEAGSLVPLNYEKIQFLRQFYIVTHKQKYISNAMQAWQKIIQKNT